MYHQRSTPVDSAALRSGKRRGGRGAGPAPPQPPEGPGAPATRKATMWETSEAAFRVNPYIRWQYDHPAHLLPHPTREALEARRAQAPGAGLHLELGSGSGNFLLELARLHPRDHVLGFELRYKRLVKAAVKLEKAGLTNVWVLREQGERFPDYVDGGSVDAIHVNFPDPWPRASQWKKRLVSAHLLDAVERALKPGGTFHLKTDHSGYFLHVLELCGRRHALKISFFSNDLRRKWPPGARIRSEFEQMFSAKQKPVFSLILEKAA